MTEDDRAPFALDEFPYLQVADRLEARIRAGEFSETGKLPSEPELRRHYGAGAGVIRHARQELMRRGLIYVNPANRGGGTFIA
jgi:DNA-binding GntR family transcriptional regulator